MALYINQHPDFWFKKNERSRLNYIEAKEVVNMAKHEGKNEQQIQTA